MSDCNKYILLTGDNIWYLPTGGQFRDITKWSVHWRKKDSCLQIPCLFTLQFTSEKRPRETRRCCCSATFGCTTRCVVVCIATVEIHVWRVWKKIKFVGGWRKRHRREHSQFFLFFFLVCARMNKWSGEGMDCTTRKCEIKNTSLGKHEWGNYRRKKRKFYDDNIKVNSSVW